MKPAAALALVCLLATAAAADRGRKKPPDPHPHVVTQQFLLKLAAGTWPLADYVDPAAGVAFIDDIEGMGDEPRSAQAKLLCGAALTRQLAATRKDLHAKLLGEYQTGGLSCRNKPAPSCEAGGTTEGDTQVRLEFQDDPARGLVLTAIVLDDDEVHSPDASQRQNARAQARRIAKLRAEHCPAPAPAAPAP